MARARRARRRSHGGFEAGSAAGGLDVSCVSGVEGLSLESSVNLETCE